MGNPPKENEKDYLHLDPLALVASRLAYVDHAKELTTWSHADFMTRKCENAPKDGAVDDVPLTRISSVWNRFLKLFRRR